ncbi:hypothetical protein B0H63DRAFT_219790 [Podospora didyma]|uniref:Uncharacterized protein n=1 Tax=Podospora didyma TaxID=330526 RepID=A0AAE0KJ66_9PEZI|nr:hypothetical protein B0H63DRAFT_219790 [Podospora didyma]
MSPTKTLLKEIIFGDAENILFRDGQVKEWQKRLEALEDCLNQARWTAGFYKRLETAKGRLGKTSLSSLAKDNCTHFKKMVDSDDQYAAEVKKLSVPGVQLLAISSTSHQLSKDLPFFRAAYVNLFATRQLANCEEIDRKLESSRGTGAKLSTIYRDIKSCLSQQTEADEEEPQAKRRKLASPAQAAGSGASPEHEAQHQPLLVVSNDSSPGSVQVGPPALSPSIAGTSKQPPGPKTSQNLLPWDARRCLLAIFPLDIIKMLIGNERSIKLVREGEAYWSTPIGEGVGKFRLYLSQSIVTEMYPYATATTLPVESLDLLSQLVEATPKVKAFLWPGLIGSSLLLEGFHLVWDKLSVGQFLDSIKPKCSKVTTLQHALNALTTTNAPTSG